MNKTRLVLIALLFTVTFLFWDEAKATVGVNEPSFMYAQAISRHQEIKYCRSMIALIKMYPNSCVSEDAIMEYRSAECNKILSKRKK